MLEYFILVGSCFPLSVTTTNSMEAFMWLSCVQCELHMHNNKEECNRYFTGSYDNNLKGGIRIKSHNPKTLESEIVTGGK